MRKKWIATFLAISLAASVLPLNVLSDAPTDVVPEDLVYADAVNVDSSEEWQDDFLEEDWAAINQTPDVGPRPEILYSNSASGGYTMTLEPSAARVTANEKLAIRVNLQHSSDTVFAAGEIKLSYDPEKLTFLKEESTLGEAKVETRQGMLTLEDYGADKNLGSAVYTLVFQAGSATGESEIQLSSAAFVNKQNAVRADLIPADYPASLTIQIAAKHTVTKPDCVEGAAEVWDGTDYTFRYRDTEHYNYQNLKATVGGVRKTVTANRDGSFTLMKVNGDVVITVEQEAVLYMIDWDYSSESNVSKPSNMARYGEDYQFNIVYLEHYIVEVTIDGEPYTGFAIDENDVCTIPGADICEGMAIKVTAATSVKITGNAAGSATIDGKVLDENGAAVVAQNSSCTLLLTPQPGYRYTVQYKMGNQINPLKESAENRYVIPQVSGPLEFIITREYLPGTVTVSQYLTLDGSVMWLVKNQRELPEGKCCTYDAVPMYCRDGVYFCLVVADHLDGAEATGKMAVEDGVNPVFAPGFDVNLSGRVDASDAQLVYNMYNANYPGFTEELPMEKYLRADANGDGRVDILDATAIIASLF